MDNQLDISRLLLLRKVTRAIADALGSQLKSHLTTLTPLFHPRTVLGEFVRGSTKQSVKGEEDALQEIRKLYTSVAAAAPFNLRKELETPLDLISTTIELSPAEYFHQATNGSENKGIMVSTPLRWVLSYSGFNVKKVREFLASQATSGGNDLYQSILHHLVLHVVFLRRPGLTRLLEAMRFSVSTTRYEGLGQLPITIIETPVRTLRPDDQVVVQSTEISGTNAFEEIIDLPAIESMADPLRLQMTELVRGFGLPPS